VRIRLDLRYDGTDFAGWAIQPDLRTVQGTVEEGLAKVLRGQRPRLVVAGRTDSKVHARGQVAHFDVDETAWAAVVGRAQRTPEDALLSRLTGVLPSDVVVHNVSVAPEGFDARFSATMRHYRYRIADAVALRDPLRRRDVLWSRRQLDVSAMNAAAQQLVGRHDFAAYCRPRPGATTIRTLTEFVWERDDDGLAVATVRADAFCHSMVRALVGAGIAVGEGKHDVQWPRELLRAKERSSSVTVAPGHGLTLEGVDYPEASQLAVRAQQTRARRATDDVDSI